MKAVVYARYSSDSQREESIDGQLRECKEYAEGNDVTILGTYIDRALSAKTDHRPEFQRMIKDSAKQLFDVVLVWKLDRFSRNRYDSAHYKMILRKNGVKVISVTEKISDGPEGIILESMLEGYAEYYSAELSEKIQRGQKENALKGKYNGGSAPLGFVAGKNQKLEIDPATAPIVLDIFKRYADGETVKSIIKSLNERNVRTRQNKQFVSSSFNVLLKNRKYVGEYKYGGVIIPDALPAIVSRDIFERTQQRMEKNKRAPSRTKADEEYLLTTKLFCGKCNCMMVGESGCSHTKQVYHYYKCHSSKRGLGCHQKSVRKDWIERVVVALTVSRVLRDEEIAHIADKLVALQEQENTLLPSLRQQLAQTEKSLENMLNAIQQGVLTSSTKQRLEALEVQKEDLEISILQTELQQVRFSKEQVICWISQFKNGDINSIDYQRQIIDIFVNSIYYFDDELIITYNYKGGTQTISRQEVDATFGSDLMSGSPPSGKPVAMRFYRLSFLF